MSASTSVCFATDKSHPQYCMIFDIRLGVDKLEYMNTFKVSKMIFGNCGIGEVIEITGKCVA